MTTTPAMPELPPLPKRLCIDDDKAHYSADQMRAYALAALQAQPAAAGVSDAEIARAVRPLYANDAAAEMGLPDDIKTVRAVLALRPQAVPMTDAPFLKVYKGSICYKSVADDQSYGMWCPVNWDTELGLKDGTVFYANHGITAPAGWEGK